jgi:hypothetical protein
LHQEVVNERKRARVKRVVDDTTNQDYTHTDTHTHAHTHKPDTNTRTHTTETRRQTQTRTHTHTYAHRHTQTHTQTYTHTGTHVPTGTTEKHTQANIHTRSQAIPLTRDSGRGRGVGGTKLQLRTTKVIEHQALKSEWSSYGDLVRYIRRICVNTQTNQNKKRKIIKPTKNNNKPNTHKRMDVNPYL